MFETIQDLGKIVDNVYKGMVKPIIKPLIDPIKETTEVLVPDKEKKKP